MSNTKATTNNATINNEVKKKGNEIMTNTNTSTPATPTPTSLQATTNTSKSIVKVTKKDKKYSIDELLAGSLNFLFKDVASKKLPIEATKNDFTSDVWNTLQTLAKINQISITEIKPLTIKTQLEQLKKVNDKLSQELNLVVTKNNSLLISNKELASDYEALKKRFDELEHNYTCEQNANSNLRKELKAYSEKLKALSPKATPATEPTPTPATTTPATEPTEPTTQSQSFNGLTIPKGMNASNSNSNNSSNNETAFSMHKQVELKPTCVVSYRLHEKKGFYMLSFKFASLKANKEARSNFLNDCKIELSNFDNDCTFTWYSHNEILIYNTSLDLQDSRYISIIINVLNEYISHGVTGFKDITIEYK